LIFEQSQFYFRNVTSFSLTSLLILLYTKVQDHYAAIIMIWKLSFFLLASMLLSKMPYYHYDPGDPIINTGRALQEEGGLTAEYEMPVKVFLTIDNFRLISESPFFKAALEQYLKDSVNINPLCRDDSDSKNGLDLMSYTSFNLDLTSQLEANSKGKTDEQDKPCVLLGSNWGGLENITCFVEIKTKCRGPREDCKKEFNERYLDNNIEQKNNKTGSKNSICDFDIRDFFTPSSIFDYGLTETGEGFEISFQQSSDIKLTDIGNVEALDNLVEVDVIRCLQCEVQLEILQEFYRNFDMELNYKNNECEQQGINCNEENKTTQIWLSEFINLFDTLIIFDNQIYSNIYTPLSDNNNVPNATITGRIGTLRSLRGLFLGKSSYFGD